MAVGSTIGDWVLYSFRNNLERDNSWNVRFFNVKCKDMIMTKALVEFLANSNLPYSKHLSKKYRVSFYFVISDNAHNKGK